MSSVKYSTFDNPPLTTEETSMGTSNGKALDRAVAEGYKYQTLGETLQKQEDHKESGKFRGQLTSKLSINIYLL